MATGFWARVRRYYLAGLLVLAPTALTFWVAWKLDVLFNGLPAGHPRFLVKGGTSLSKAYGLISRFSEDIDITVFREDIGQAASVPELEGLSRKKGSVANRCCGA